MPKGSYTDGQQNTRAIAIELNRLLLGDHLFNPHDARMIPARIRDFVAKFLAISGVSGAPAQSTICVSGGK